MTKKVVTIPLGKMISEVAILLKKHDIGSIIVVDDKLGKHAKGIVTERDLVGIIAKGLDPHKLKAEDVMAKPLRATHPDISLEEAANAMKKNKIRRLPVLNEQNELVGIITEGDIMRVFPAIVDLLEEKSAIA